MIDSITHGNLFILVVQNTEKLVFSFFQFIFVFTFVDYESSTYGDYKFPGWADGIGWFLAVMMVIPIPIVILYKIGYADSYLSVREVCTHCTLESM